MFVENLKPLHIFVDESGDFNFSPSGTRYYTISALATFFPKEREKDMLQLHRNILCGKLCSGLEVSYLTKKLSRMFHATEDKQPVRNLVFRTIADMCYLRTFSIVIQKNKMNPVLYEPATFYPQFLGYLLDYIFKKYLFSEVNIYVSGTPVSGRQKAFKKAVSHQIECKGIDKPYTISYPRSETVCMLQVVDYINWAIYRKWEKGDSRSYELIKHLLGKNELVIFERGDTCYYRY